ncbi:MAG: hypothetical protein IPH10_04230 [bacterium]|nr:hypothetical protein [bacterium]
MTIWQAVILGIVQGITEFLPVSSDGHLVVVQHLLGLSGPLLTFDVFIHLGTLAAVLLYFRKLIAEACDGTFQYLSTTRRIAIAVAGCCGDHSGSDRWFAAEGCDRGDIWQRLCGGGELVRHGTAADLVGALRSWVAPNGRHSDERFLVDWYGAGIRAAAGDFAFWNDHYHRNEAWSGTG